MREGNKNYGKIKKQKCRRKGRWSCRKNNRRKQLKVRKGESDI
jgi:hypothetical protein